MKKMERYFPLNSILELMENMNLLISITRKHSSFSTLVKYFFMIIFDNELKNIKLNFYWN